MKDILYVEEKSNCSYDVSDHFTAVVHHLSRVSDHPRWTKEHLKGDEFERLMYQTEIEELLNLDTNCADVTPTEEDRFANIFTNISLL